MRGRLDVRALVENVAFPSTADERGLARSLGRLEQDDVPAFRKRPRLRDRLFGSRQYGPADDEDFGAAITSPEVPRTRVRVIAVTGHVIVIELETPSDGFLRPDGKVRLFNVDDLLGLGGVDPIGSSPIGPHAKGLILRIVIIGSDNWRCAVGDEITIEEVKTA
jgi:hypothetical protein